MPENTTTEQNTIRTPRWFWLVFFALTVFVYFFGLTLPLLGPDEPRYAEVGREMFLRNDWITPTLGGFNWFEKPALLYWLEIVSYHIFGVNEFAARVGPALCGLGTIISVWLLCPSLRGLVHTRKRIGDVPEDVAAALLPGDDRDAIVVARGTVKAVYAPARDEAVVTVEIEPLLS